MPGTAGAAGDSGLCHVMLRGIGRQRIFEDDEDRFPEIPKKSGEEGYRETSLYSCRQKDISLFSDDVFIPDCFQEM